MHLLTGNRVVTKMISVGGDPLILKQGAGGNAWYSTLSQRDILLQYTH
jgi:hypothetical protein